MNRYILIRRLRGPAILLLLGIIALLHESGLVEFWSLFFPLLLILIGVLKLAERAATTMSQASARFAPAPAATPLTAHTTGFGKARSRRTSGL